jgi:alanyl-tRNA synthetase
MQTTNDIRRSFLDYFAGHGHEIVPSAPLIPYNDPTLMFINAGMVPFKNIFTGVEKSSYSTATSSQKCVRAGGKHNDLDNVGYTARHHTFFEMLGNFSFGDYFKEQAIDHAWTLITKVWGISPDRLTVTVFHTDDEAFDLWKKIAGLPEERIIRIATSDNFWSMGDTGPCGPCSEIFYDHGEHIAGGPPGSPDEDGDRFVEIWNLVFMQYDQRGEGDRVDLPKPSIAESGQLTGTVTTGDNQASHRVIADHLRASSFLVADGVLPSNEGRGYVLRRIMRRAMRHAHLLGAKDPLMHRMVGSLTGEMGNAFPELIRAKPLIEETLLREETNFRQTLANGLKLLDAEIADMGEGDVLPGETAFKLYDTFGFPYDLTEDALRAKSLGVDRTGFDKAMAEQKAAARAAWKGSGDQASDAVWFDIAEREGSTEFTGYTSEEGEGVVVALVKDGKEIETASSGDSVILLTNQTPFYGESGGQMGDAGEISGADGFAAVVADTRKPLGRLHAHQIEIRSGSVAVGDSVHLRVDEARRTALRANHSATHLLHKALRHHLGDHVTQKGSLVAPDRLRFDFSHPTALTDKEIKAVEADVNAQIRGNSPVTTRLMSPDDAVAAGALALFGEKYGDEVRVLSMGRDADLDYSVELCGGTHVNALGDIGVMVIISESAVASGVRRIEALTGEAARLWLLDRDAKLKSIAAALKASPEEAADRVVTLVEERKKLERELTEAKKALALAGDGGGAKAAETESIGDIAFTGQVIQGLNPKELRGLVDQAKKKLASGISALVAVNDGRATVAVGVTDDLTDRFSAVDLVQAGVAAVGGKGGGGRPDMAQGGGPDGVKADDAIAAIRTVLAG